MPIHKLNLRDVARSCVYRTTYRHWLGLVMVSLCFVAGSAAGAVPLWGDLKPGPYEVGFTTMEFYDYSRTFSSPRDYYGNPVAGETARPIQICVWYPAGPSDAPSLMLSDYALPYPEDGRFYEFLSQLQPREALFIGAITGTEGGQIVELLNLRVKSRRGAPMADGSFPVILYCPNRGRGVIENSVMCEYLASNGYVVASTHSVGTESINVEVTQDYLETAVTDLGLLLTRLREMPFADVSNIGVIGTGFGGMVGLLLQMRNYSVRAVVCIDGFTASHQFIRENPYYNAVRATSPILVASRSGATVTALVDSMKYSTRHLISFASAERFDLTTYGKLVSAARRDSVTARTPNETYEVLCRHVRDFLDVSLQEATATEFLFAPAPSDDFSVEVRHGEDAPPSALQFYDIIQHGSVDSALTLAERFVLFAPEDPVFPEATINSLGYGFLQAGNVNAAVEFLRFGTEAYPHSANAWDSYGEANRHAENIQEAIAAYEKALELLPFDTTTAESLKEAIRTGATQALERLKGQPESSDEG
ncbi:MAG: hypothetical protein JSU65_13305 [Candidatus Zixiibacteriota bacterium]|nr:MAG: hypothetical protein JSU65_13305 [candidate division Zixibacteria bacterium]